MKSSDEGQWSTLPPGTYPSRPAADSADEGPIDTRARVIGLGALCDLNRRSDDGRSVSFWVSEFALLDDHRRVVLRDDLGFTIGWGSSDSSNTSAVWESETARSIEQDVLNVVLPDEDTEEDHPWEWLAHLARSRGLHVTAEDLRGLPYSVHLADPVVELLSTG